MPATSMFSLTVTGTPCSGPPDGRCVRGVGGGPRLVGEHERDRVEVAVDGLDALQVRVDDLARGHLAARDQLGQFPGAAAPQLLGHFAPLVDPSAPYLAGIAGGAAGSASGMTRLALALATAAALAAPATASAAPEVRTAAGATPAALDPAVAAFRADVGAARREIDWDGAPQSRLPGSFFAARGAQLDTPGLGGEVFDPAGPTWGAGMKPYSGKQLFTPVGLERHRRALQRARDVPGGDHGRVRDRALRRRHGHRRGADVLRHARQGHLRGRGARRAERALVRERALHRRRARGARLGARPARRRWSRASPSRRRPTSPRSTT